MLKDFKEFARKGVLDLAAGVIIGAAFRKIDFGSLFAAGHALRPLHLVVVGTTCAHW